MQITRPLEITPSLMAGVRVGDGWVGVEEAGDVDGYGKPAWRYQISAEGIEHEGDDLYSFGHEREVIASLLDFLGAAAEAYGYKLRTGRESDNSDLFPPDVTAWAYQNKDELSILVCELEEDNG